MTKSKKDMLSFTPEEMADEIELDPEAALASPLLPLLELEAPTLRLTQRAKAACHGRRQDAIGNVPPEEPLFLEDEEEEYDLDNGFHTNPIGCIQQPLSPSDAWLGEDHFSASTGGWIICYGTKVTIRDGGIVELPVHMEDLYIEWTGSHWELDDEERNLKLRGIERHAV